jgi:hypothetical protein
VIRTSTWTYETVRRHHLTNATCATFGAGSLAPGPRDVTIRLAVLGEGGVGIVNADDFHVSCTIG